MAAFGALGRRAEEEGVADVTVSTNPLADGLANQILSATAGRDGENDFLSSLRCGVFVLSRGFALLTRRRSGGCIVLLGGRISEALGAANVVAR
jgi:hypothetical protein